MADRCSARARGQTEMLGFALLFGTVMLMILIVTATASGGMLKVAEDRRVGNAEVAMTALSDNVGDLTRGEAPSRSTQFDLDGGRLSLGERSPLTVSPSGGSPTETFQLRPLVYRSPDGTELVYFNGMVVRDDGHGAAVIDDAGGSASVLTFVRFEAADRTDAVGGDGVVSISTVRTESTVVADDDGAYDVTLHLTSQEAATAWKQHLSARDGVADCERSGNSVSCTVDTDQVSIVVIDVEVRFD